MIGKIVKAISGFYYIEYEDYIYECRAKGVLKKNNISPLVGDFVDFEKIDDKTGNLVNVVNRKNYLVRPPVANLDAVIIVVAVATPEPSLLFLDKQLAFLESINITPIICLNKTDLEDAEKINNIYSRIGYKIISTSVKENEGIDELRNIIAGKVVSLVGNSGVGKSSLTNALLGQEIMEEGSLSKIERGKQTTRHSELLKVKEDTYIIDTPGFSSFELSNIETNELANLFIEFRNKMSECKYNDCRHILEEECGIRNAVISGEISNTRFENFKILYSELANKRKY